MNIFNLLIFLYIEGCDVSLKDELQLLEYSNFYLLNSTEDCAVEQAYYLTCGGNLVSLDYFKTNRTKQFEIISVLGPKSVNGFALRVSFEAARFYVILRKASMLFSYNHVHSS